MKRLLITFIAFIISIVSYGDSYETIDGLVYLIHSKDNTATLVTLDSAISDIIVPESISIKGRKYPIVSFGDYSLSDRTYITSVVIPRSVKRLGHYCFSNCSSLKSINIPESVIYIGDYCFSDCDSLNTIDIPESVISIGKGCFSSCSSLMSISIPMSITSLGGACFSNCTSLHYIEIPSSVVSLGDYCFKKCPSLTTMKLPPSIKSIGYKCFSESSNVDTFYCYAPIPPTILSMEDLGWNFIYVPLDYLDTYKKDEYWQGRVFEIPESEGLVISNCERPIISYSDKQLHFESSTIGAKYHYTISVNDITPESFCENGDVELEATYNITAYATANGYAPSKLSEAKLYWINGEVEMPTLVSNAIKRGILVKTNNGVITLSGLDEGERVSFYSISGEIIGSAIANNSTITISFPLEKIIIAKIGKSTLKISL